MNQIAIAIAIYKKDSERTAKDIIGVKIFPATEYGRPDFSAPAMIVWRQNVEALLLTGLEAPVFESLPQKK